MEFFQSENSQKTIARFLKNIEVLNMPNNLDQQRVKCIRDILNYIYRSPKEWDERCEFNIKYIGQNLINELGSFGADGKKDYIDIYSLLFRFLCEFEFMIEPSKELSHEARQIRKFITQDINNLDENNKSQFIYAAYTMPVQIAKHYMDHEQLTDVKKFNKIVNAVPNMRKEWKDEIEKKQNEVIKIKETLEQYETAFNFVGLYKGFNDISTEKKKEIRPLFKFLITMGIILLLPLVAEFTFVLNNLDYIKDNSQIWWALIFPVISIELILIYFFRIILLDYKSVKGQLLQIELRKTLCQFIQNYAEYSNKIKTDNLYSLEKFENLIFSNIVTDTENIPSTFDGIDQISKLIAAAKK